MREARGQPGRATPGDALASGCGNRHAAAPIDQYVNQTQFHLKKRPCVNDRDKCSGLWGIGDAKHNEALQARTAERALPQGGTP